jgi:hypothetical protein
VPKSALRRGWLGRGIVGSNVLRSSGALAVNASIISVALKQ